MDEAKVQLIQIIRAVVCRDGTELPTDLDWNAVWALAEKNHLETVVCAAAPDSFRSKIQGECYRQIARSIQQEAVLQQLEGALAKYGVPYAPQKGSLLRCDYPEPHLRYMSDLDLYIQTQKRDSVRTVVQALQGSLYGTESGDDQFLFPGGIVAEFHGRLLYRKTSAGIENYADWSFVNEAENRLTEEGFALNLIGHAVYDLSKGGPGVRYILDLWVYRHLHQPQPDWDLVQNRLKQDGIQAAANHLLSLSEYLFSGAEGTDVTKELAEYVLAVGLHGDRKRKTELELAKAGSKRKAFLRQVFRSRAEYENRYPWLKRFPFLRPVAWIMRIVKSRKTHGKAIRSWFRQMKNANQTEAEKQQEQQSRFGL